MSSKKNKFTLMILIIFFVALVGVVAIIIGDTRPNIYKSVDPEWLQLYLPGSSTLSVQDNLLVSVQNGYRDSSFIAAGKMSEDSFEEWLDQQKLAVRIDVGYFDGKSLNQIYDDFGVSSPDWPASFGPNARYVSLHVDDTYQSTLGFNPEDGTFLIYAWGLEGVVQPQKKK